MQANKPLFCSRNTAIQELFEDNVNCVYFEPENPDDLARKLIRNIGSTSVSQLIDNTIFVLLAFAFAVPTAALVQIWVAGYMIKVAVAFLDTPFIYASYQVMPRPLAEEA